MANREDVMDALLTAIAKAADAGRPAQAVAARDFAEAYAWLYNPAQPHGGHASSS